MKNLLLTLSFLIFITPSQAQAPQLWTTCLYGGEFGFGAIIKSDSTGNSFHVVYSFDQTNGAYPYGNLCSGGNGKLYGVTQDGGYYDGGFCYSYDTSTGVLNAFHDFFQNLDYGYSPGGEMMQATDGMLYGVDVAGGLYGTGVLYRVDPSDDSYSPVYNFMDATGSSPLGGLIQLSDGKLYGTAYGGGLNGWGVIYSFDPLDSSYTDLYDFSLASGVRPEYGKLLKATDGKLYGLAVTGGGWGKGVIFSYDVATHVYTDVFDFIGFNGWQPMGEVIQANNGLLYGMTNWGGPFPFQYGVIFSFDISTYDYTVLYNFNDTSGYAPEGSLIQGSNGKLFGTTRYGGEPSGGTAFSFDITDSTFTKLIDFASIGCSGSTSDILETGFTVASNVSPAPVKSTMKFDIYPNPATDHVALLGKILTAQTRVELWDGQGKRIEDFSVKGNTLSISHLPSGFYILKITDGNTVGYGKFVKE